MHSVEIHKIIGQIISLFYRCGLWHREDTATPIAVRTKLLYCIYHSLFPISVMVGAITSDNHDESVMLADAAIVIAVLTVKLWILVWKQKEIVELLNRICIFSTRDHEIFNSVNTKLSKFSNFATVMLVFINIGIICICSVPFIGTENTLYMNIAFPLDWKNNQIAFWIANAFIFTEMYLSLIIVMFSVTIWYLVFCCSLRYEVLGNEIRNMGHRENMMKISSKEKQKLFLNDLKKSIDVHLCLKEYNQMELNSFL